MRATPKWAALSTEIGSGAWMRNERDSTRNGCGGGGGRKDGEMNDTENGRRKRWGRRASLLVLTISNESLGAEGSLSGVGIPPLHNLDTPHALVAGEHTHTHTHS